MASIRRVLGGGRATVYRAVAPRGARYARADDRVVLARETWTWWPNARQPALPIVSGRWRSACLSCGYRIRYGCAVDAKYSPITVQGDSFPFEGKVLDLDPTYTDPLGRPLLRLTFDFASPSTSATTTVRSPATWRSAARS